jgi:hypothetical protein
MRQTAGRLARDGGTVIALRQGAPLDVVLDIGIGLYGGIGYRLEPDPKLAAARSGVIHAWRHDGKWKWTTDIGRDTDARKDGFPVT